VFGIFLFFLDIMMKKIEIIEHRGGWCDSFENVHIQDIQNSMKTFEKSFQRGNGIEFDIRDLNGVLVISHNMPTGEESRLEELLKLYHKYKCSSSLAINIKSSELQGSLKSLLEKYKIKNYFTFDMSIPDTLKYMQAGLTFYIRHSEYESYHDPYLYEKATGVWLDQFNEISYNSSWQTRKILEKHLRKDKKVVIVSPELHPWGRRPQDKLYQKVWSIYKENFESLLLKNYNISKIAICTDFPEEAYQFFIG